MNIEILKDIGKLCYKIRNNVKELIREGIDILEIIEYIEEEIEKERCSSAFPCTICRNEEAAHFTIFDEEIKLKKGDVVKVDFGIERDGWIVDNAITVEVGTSKYTKQIKANEEGLKKLLNFIKPQIELWKIGNFIHKYAKEKGYETIHNLTGHEIKRYNLHAGLNVPNYNNNSTKIINNESIIAVEPFFTKKCTLVVPGKNSNILHLINKTKNVRDKKAREVLKYIKENYPELPFAKRWLLSKFNKREVSYSISILKKEGIIKEYEVLITQDRSIVTQFEETIVFHKGEKYITTNPEL